MSITLLFLFFLLSSSFHVEGNGGVSNLGSLVTKDGRKTVTATESGQISAVEISDGPNRIYHLHFITLEPNSLFLPVLLQQDMVFYVHTGKGSLGWAEANDMNHMEIQSGDIYRLDIGSVFYLRSKPDPMGAKLRLYAIFSSTNNEDSSEPFTREYSRITDLILGFDEKILQAAFKVSEEVIEGMMKIVRPKSIIPMREKEMDSLDWKEGIFEALIGVGKSKKSNKPFNIHKKKADFKNKHGWSLAVNSKDIPSLRGSNIGLFAVNLTQGSMMGPHWNPRATEIAVVTHGEGMVVVVCPKDTPGCENSRFKVREGDVFVVPRFHPMAQISSSNDSLTFMGFSTMPRKNYPQFLVGKRSVLKTFDQKILAMSFGVSESVLKEILNSQKDEIILACPFCAKEEEEKMEKEMEKKRQEEEAKEREEEAKKRKEEEARRRKEEEETRKREEEAREREEEEKEARRRKEEEEARKREEEEAKKREEEEEEARRRKEEEARKREEEAKKREEEEEAEEKEEEEARRREEEEAEEKEEEEARRREEEAKKREEEEEEAQRRKEEEEARKREEEARWREKEAKKKEEEEEEEEAHKREEEEEARWREKEAKKREEEKEAKKREEEEEEAQKREEEEEEEARWREKEAKKEEEEEREEETRQREEEWRKREAKKREEERREREKEEHWRERGEGEAMAMTLKQLYSQELLL